MTKTKKDYDKDWIIEKSVEILKTYSDPITVRALYYLLVTRGMTNDPYIYKKMDDYMVDARWDGIIPFEAFIDRDRRIYGATAAEPILLSDQIETGKTQIKAWMDNYTLNPWENQPNYVEVWIEKVAQQGNFEKLVDKYSMGLAPCKGHPSLTYLNDSVPRFNSAIQRGQKPIILYFGDFDPRGLHIPVKLCQDIEKRMRMRGTSGEVELKRIALNEDQVINMNLITVPPKASDSMSPKWLKEHGNIGVAELDAIEPKTLSQMVTDEIAKYFDPELYKELLEREEIEREQYQKALKTFVSTL